MSDGWGGVLRGLLTSGEGTGERLKHVGDPDRLMNEHFTAEDGYGTKLTRAECRPIFQTLDRYPC